MDFVKPTTPCLISELIVNQIQLRDFNKIPKMIDYVKNGGVFTLEAMEEFEKENPRGRRPLPIFVAIYPDGKKYLWDGHHRGLAIFLGNRKEILPSEYLIVYQKYENVTSILWDKGFVTPFDPRTEVRTANFYSFKMSILKLAETNKELATQLIWSSRSEYATKRTLFTIEELAKFHGLLALKQDKQQEDQIQCLEDKGEQSNLYSAL